MNANPWIKVARYHLVDRISLTVGPWGILTFDFLVFLAVVAMMGPARYPQSQSGALGAIYLVFLVTGALVIFKSLPFALALGVSRRSYYAGTTLLADKAPLTAAQAAAIILDGVRSGTWRILIGQDAEWLDRLVRARPEVAYDYQQFFNEAAVAECTSAVQAAGQPAT